MAPSDLFEIASLLLVDRSAEPRAGEVEVIDLPELMVILEALLDAKDITRLDSGEVGPFDDALSRVDRETSITTWPRTEPAEVTRWRLGVLSRAARSEVARAILHALDPYHALIRTAHPRVPTAVLTLPSAAVAAVRTRAVVAAWLVQIEPVVAHDRVEREAWLRYWVTVSSRAGTREHTIAWQRGVAQRAEAGSEVAGRVIDSIRQRDRAIVDLGRAAADVDTFVVHVPRGAR